MTSQAWTARRRPHWEAVRRFLYDRGTELRLAGPRSLRIAIGTVPLLLVAASVEAFVSPSAMPPLMKGLVSASLGLALVAYLGFFGTETGARGSKVTRAGGA
jgi:hypothetical protein